MTARSHQRSAAERLVGDLRAVVETRRATAREAHRLFRAHHAATSIPRWVWYAAVRAVAGCGLLDLPNARQRTLIARAPSRRRSRPSRKKPS